MEGLNLLEQEKVWYPLSFLGITNQYTAINCETVINTWIVLIAMGVIVIIARYFLARPESMGHYIVTSIIKSFVNLIEQSAGRFVDSYYKFITSLFLFILSCNWISLIYTIEEPTKDLNTPLALGIIAFLYTQKEVIKAHGILAYLKDFFMPINIMFPFNLLLGIVMLPLKILGELATIVSISFRLFGNIFGGFIITSIYHHAISGSVLFNILGTATGFNIVITSFFILFEGFLQAFVFSILSITNIAMAVQTENEEFHS